MIAGEARHKLMAPITFGFDRLFASDVQGRSRAFAALIGAGMDLEEAKRVTGMTDGVA